MQASVLATRPAFGNSRKRANGVWKGPQHPLHPCPRPGCCPSPQSRSLPSWASFHVSSFPSLLPSPAPCTLLWKGRLCSWASVRSPLPPATARRLLLSRHLLGAVLSPETPTPVCVCEHRAMEEGGCQDPSRLTETSTETGDEEWLVHSPQLPRGRAQAAGSSPACPRAAGRSRGAHRLSAAHFLREPLSRL